MNSPSFESVCEWCFREEPCRRADLSPHTWPAPRWTSRRCWPPWSRESSASSIAEDSGTTMPRLHVRRVGRRSTGTGRTGRGVCARDRGAGASARRSPPSPGGLERGGRIPGRGELSRAGERLRSARRGRGASGTTGSPRACVSLCAETAGGAGADPPDRGGSGAAADANDQVKACVGAFVMICTQLWIESHPCVLAGRSQ